MQDIINSLVQSEKQNLDSMHFPCSIRNKECLTSLEITQQSSQKLRRTQITAPIFFVDGGQQTILKTASTSIELIQIAGVSIDPSAQIQTIKESYIFHAKQRNNTTTITIYDQQGKESQTLEYINEQEPTNHARRLLELTFLQKHANKFPQFTILGIDGSLTPHDDQENEVIEQLCNQAMNNNHVVIGISKSTSLMCTNGHSITSVTNVVCPQRQLSQLPVGATKQAQLYMVRLHENSFIPLRCDIQKNQQVDTSRIMGQLATISNDPAFLGYPYPLIKADLIARVSNEQIQNLQATQNLAFTKDLDILWQEQAAAHAHDKLDTMRF